MRACWVFWTTAIAALALGCSDYELVSKRGSNGEGEIAIDVSPRSIDFLGASSGETVIETFAVTNVGASRATLGPLELQSTDSFSIIGDPLPDYLDPGDFVDVEVAFAPEAAGERLATALVHSDDSDEPEIPVALVGYGLVPELRITPAEHDFGSVAVSCAADVTLTLENIGEAELTLEEIEFEGDPGLTLEVAPTVPFRLAPGGRTPAVVRFAPAALGSVNSTLSVYSNEPMGVRHGTQWGVGGGGDPRSEVFEFDDHPPVDLLFAIDQSCSMDDDAARVAAEFPPLLQAIDAVTAGWQVGVVTLDSGCVNDAVFESSSSDVEARFSDAALLGEDRDILDDEALLKLSHRALTQTGPGGCNEGLVRAGAALHVIVVSDEPERSQQQRSSWTWDHWLDAMRAATPDSASLVISGVVDLDDCAEGDDGYAEAIAATGGAHLSLCQSDWTGYAEALADATLERAWTLPLSDDPIVETITVTVDGVETTDWTWDAEAGAVVLGSDPGSSVVEVHYQVTPDCD